MAPRWVRVAHQDMKKKSLFWDFASLSGPNSLAVKLETIDLVKSSILSPTASTCKEIQTVVYGFLNQMATEVMLFLKASPCWHLEDSEAEDCWQCSHRVVVHQFFADFCKSFDAALIGISSFFPSEFYKRVFLMTPYSNLQRRPGSKSLFLCISYLCCVHPQADPGFLFIQDLVSQA